MRREALLVFFNNLLMIDKIKLLLLYIILMSLIYFALFIVFVNSYLDKSRVKLAIDAGNEFYYKDKS